MLLQGYFPAVLCHDEYIDWMKRSMNMTEQNPEQPEPTQPPEPGPEETETEVDPGDTSGDEAQQDTGALQE